MSEKELTPEEIVKKIEQTLEEVKKTSGRNRCLYVYGNGKRTGSGNR